MPDSQLPIDERVDTPPMPPATLRTRVAGTDDANWFDQCGQMSVDEWSKALAAIGFEFSSFPVVLDYGCGCGRTLRWFRQKIGRDQKLIGADVDREAIAWLSNNLPNIETIVLPENPPSPIKSNSIDLVVSHSVFTHLPERVQFAWLDELHRVTKPGAIIITSIHGRNAMTQCVEALRKARNHGDADKLVTGYSGRGFHYFPHQSEAERSLPSYYGAAFHNFNYIESSWLPRGFRLRALFPTGALGYQDLMVLQRV